MSLSKTIRDIKSLRIQGATAVAREALKALAEFGRGLNKDGHKYIVEIDRAAAKLAAARPTEPLLHNGLNYAKSQLRKSSKEDSLQLTAILEKAVADWLEFIQLAEDEAIKKGKQLIKKNANIFTHCHSSLVEKILVNAWQDKQFNVFNTETRPRYQGRITATNLLKAGLPVTMVADSASDFLISKHSGKELMMDMVIIGADSISHQGDVYNKIGSYGIALAAYEAGIPVYIAASALKMDADDKIEVELRDEHELWNNRPKNLEILNFAFDMIPAKFITGILCEFGVVKPGLLKSKVKKAYPWLIQDN
ncbi:MAG: translation initiation factor eIF-2B [Candidatus Komeilibacteria bacterium]